MQRLKRERDEKKGGHRRAKWTVRDKKNSVKKFILELSKSKDVKESKNIQKYLKIVTLPLFSRIKELETALKIIEVFLKYQY